MLDLWEHFWAGCGSGLQDDDSPIQAGGRLPPGVGRAPPGVHAGGCRTLAKNPHLLAQTRLQTRAPGKLQTANISVQVRPAHPPGDESGAAAR